MKPGDITINIAEKSEFGKFNKQRIFNDGKNPMFSLGHNLIKIAEGTTVSYAVDSDEKNRETPTYNISPFNIFG